MWDPSDPRLQTDPVEVEKLAVFAACVANKPALPTFAKVNAWLATAGPRSPGPFGLLRARVTRGLLAADLREFRLPPYRIVEARLGALSEFAGRARSRFHWTRLVGRHGYGVKTPRFVGLYGFDADVVCPDVHVLRWCAAVGFVPPRAGPAARFAALEAFFLAIARDRRLRPWELDREVWMAGRDAAAAKRSPAAGKSVGLDTPG